MNKSGTISGAGKGADKGMGTESSAPRGGGQRPLKIGTRGSSLAREQTESVVSALKAAYPELAFELVTIRTEGDWSFGQAERRLDPDRGGKGQFTGAIENELLAGRIDLAVHSLKDVPSVLPAGAALGHFMAGEDPRDIFVSGSGRPISELPQGAVIGTASLRRKAIIKKHWPHLDVRVIRGNVPTRLEKLGAGQVDGLVLAAAGMKRIGFGGQIKQFLDPEEFVPCGGQGIIGIEIREGDTELAAILEEICCPETTLRALAERACLKALGGSCHSPLGVNLSFDKGSDFKPEEKEQSQTRQVQKEQAENEEAKNRQAGLRIFCGDPDGAYDHTSTYSATLRTPEEASDFGYASGRDFLSGLSEHHIQALGLGLEWVTDKTPPPSNGAPPEGAGE